MDYEQKARDVFIDMVEEERKKNAALAKRVERQQRVIDAAKEWLDEGEYDEPVPHTTEHLTAADRLVCELTWFFGEEDK